MALVSDYSEFSRIWIGSGTFRGCYSVPRFYRKFQCLFPVRFAVNLWNVMLETYLFENTSISAIRYTDRAGLPSFKLWFVIKQQAMKESYSS